MNTLTSRPQTDIIRKGFEILHQSPPTPVKVEQPGNKAIQHTHTGKHNDSHTCTCKHTHIHMYIPTYTKRPELMDMD